MRDWPRGSQKTDGRLQVRYIYNNILKEINSMGIIPSTNQDPIATGDRKVKSLFWPKIISSTAEFALSSYLLALILKSDTNISSLTRVRSN